MSDDGAAGRRRSAATGRKRRLRGLLLLLALGLCWPVWDAATFATSLRVFAVPSGSMAPSLVAGDRVCVETTRRAPPRRGEIWVFRMPKAAAAAQGFAVKRVVGLPGETVEVAAGRVTIDGRPLAEPYRTAPMTYTLPPIELGPDQYLVLGDSRNASNDGHLWGPLSRDRLVGRVLGRYWPPRRIGGL
jgi:signal peptidase I